MLQFSDVYIILFDGVCAKRWHYVMDYCLLVKFRHFICYDSCMSSCMTKHIEIYFSTFWVNNILEQGT